MVSSSKEIKTTSMSINMRKDREDRVYIHSRLLLSHENNRILSLVAAGITPKDM